MNGTTYVNAVFKDLDQLDVNALLADLNARLGITAVVVTHNERLAASLPRRLRLSAGRLE